MDPIGLALEHFDGIGAFREQDDGVAIDASGELDGVQFSDARGLGSALAQDPNVASCFARSPPNRRLPRATLSISRSKKQSVMRCSARRSPAASAPPA